MTEYKEPNIHFIAQELISQKSKFPKSFTDLLKKANKYVENREHSASESSENTLNQKNMQFKHQYKAKSIFKQGHFKKTCTHPTSHIRIRNKSFKCNSKLPSNYFVKKKDFTHALKYKCPHCSKSFFKKECLNKHLVLHVEEYHTCEICENRIASTVDYDLHMRKHIFKDLVCNICFKTFRARRQLEAHEKDHIDLKPSILIFNCPLCDDTFPVKSDFENHLEGHEKIKPHLCTFCNKEFFLSYLMGKHYSSHFSSEKCNICSKSFDNQRLLYAHERNDHLNIRQAVDSSPCFVCDVCGIIFALKEQLINHCDTLHEANTKYHCKFCDKNFFFVSAYQIHMASHTEARKFQCSLCEKCFKYKCDLSKHHNTIHSNGKVYNCDLCPKTFKRRAHLKIHLSIHAGEKPHVCEFCNMSFNRKGNLQRHYTRHYTEKPFKCDQCDAAYTRKVHLLTHKKFHGTDYGDLTGGAHTCVMCGLHFHVRSELKCHLRIVHPKAPENIMCHVCGKLLKTKASFDKHLKLHTGIRPYKCNHCDKAYIQRKNLLSHMSYRHPEVEIHYPFKCNYCNKAYFREPKLQAHLKNCHQPAALSIEVMNDYSALYR